MGTSVQCSVQDLKEALNKAWKELDEKSLKPFLDSLKNRVYY